MWVVASVMGLAILILLVFCIPLEFTFRMQVAGRPEFGVRVLWGFGLVRKALATKKKPPEKKSRANLFGSVSRLIHPTPASGLKRPAPVACWAGDLPGVGRASLVDRFVHP